MLLFTFQVDSVFYYLPKWVPAKGWWCSVAGKVTTGLAESKGSLPLEAFTSFIFIRIVLTLYWDPTHNHTTTWHVFKTRLVFDDLHYFESDLVHSWTSSWLHLWRTSYFLWPNYISLQSLLLSHSSTSLHPGDLPPTILDLPLHLQSRELLILSHFLLFWFIWYTMNSFYENDKVMERI